MIKTDASKEEKTFNEDIKLWIEETKTPRYKYITEHVLNILKNMSLKNKDILEIGCGISPYFKHLSENKIYGLDISKKLLDMNEYKKAKLIRGDILKCSKYFKKKFDLILIIGVIHHIPEKNHETALKEIVKISKKGGILLIVEPNMISLTGLFYIARKIAEKILPKKGIRKIIGFSSKEEKYIYPSRFSKLLKENGFLIIKKYSIGLIRLPPFKFLKKIPLDRINKKFDNLLRKFKINLGTTIVFISKRRR